MITWMTRRDMPRTMKDLTDKDLIIGLEDCKHIFDVVTGMTSPDGNRPVYKMWSQYEFALGIYGMLMSMELTMNRHVADKTFWHFKDAIAEMKKSFAMEDVSFTYEKPPWFEDTDVLMSHRSNLVRRYPERYGDKWKSVQEDMPYLWPIITEDGDYDLFLSKADKAKLESGEVYLTDDQKMKVANI